jgi:HD superfamily phosphodiesterase
MVCVLCCLIALFEKCLVESVDIVVDRQIAKKIEEEMEYPGQIKVTVIRELRASETAR